MQNIKKYILDNKFYCIFLFLIFLLGLFLRLKLYMMNICLQLDEVYLAKNLPDPYSSLLYPLKYEQVAPHVFVFVSKFFFDLITDISKESYFLHFQSLFYSVLTLLIFPVFTSKFLSKKWLICLAYLLFVINFPLILYSCTLKPYICDVLFAMIIITIFLSINIDICSKRKLLFYGIFLGVTPWFSSTASFVLLTSVISFLFVNRHNIRNIKLLYLFIPILLNIVVYTIFFVVPVLNCYFARMVYLWFDFYRTISMKITQCEIIRLLGFPYPFSFKFVLYFYYLMILFIAISIKNKNILYIIFPIVLVFLLHVLKIYPLDNRLSLFIIPNIIVLFIMPLDFLKNNKKYVYMFCIIFILLLQLFVLNLPLQKKLHDYYSGTYNDFIEISEILYMNNSDNKKITDFVIPMYTAIPCEYHCNKYDIKLKLYSYDNVDIHFEDNFAKWYKDFLKDKKEHIVLIPAEKEQDVINKKHVKINKKYEQKSYYRDNDKIEILYVQYEE